jgi:hypothetical protein
MRSAATVPYDVKDPKIFREWESRGSILVPLEKSYMNFVVMVFNRLAAINVSVSGGVTDN